MRVDAIRPLTAHAVEITLAVPAELVSEFAYTSGQYATVRCEIDGHVEQRSYSLCAPPEDGLLRIGVKRAPGGVVSTWLVDHVAVGDVLSVLPPTGTFISRYSPTAAGRSEAVTLGAAGPRRARYVAFAAGSGITPIMAILRTLLADDPDARFDLVYSNRSAADVMFADDLAELERSAASRLVVHHVFSRDQRPSPARSGRVDAELLQAMFDATMRPDEVDEWFLCGPSALVTLISEQLTAAGVSEDKVRIELFDSASSGATAVTE